LPDANKNSETKNMKCKKQVNPTEKKSKSQYSPGHTLRVPEG